MERVTCDNCKNEFSVNVKAKKYKQGIRETYFICPVCNHRYVSYFTNQDIRKLQARAKAETNAITRKRLSKKINDKTVKLTKEMMEKHYNLTS